LIISLSACGDDDRRPPDCSLATDGVCPAGCPSDPDCTAVDAGEPDAPMTAELDIYEICESPSQCEQSCHEYSGSSTGSLEVGKICSADCSTSADCPDTADGLPGVCADLNRLFFQCYPSCITDADCLGDFGCASVSGFGMVCTP